MNVHPRILALFGARIIFGSERANIEALAALRDEGCEVLCIIRDEPWNDQIQASLAERGLASERAPYIDGWMRGWRCWVLLRNPIAFVRGNLRFLRIARTFRPTHVHAFNSLYVLSFILALSLVRLPMIYRAGDEPVRHRWVWRVVWSFIVAHTYHFVAISKFIQRKLESTGVPADKITLLYGRPPLRPDRPAAPEFPEGFPSIVFVGQIAEHKGPHLLVQAVHNLAPLYPDLRLLIAGPISDWRGDAWAQLLRSRVTADPLLNDRVTFLGNVNNVPALLRRCMFLVAPSLWEEPLGLVVIEAKEAGIPSVVFPRGGLPELIEHQVDGYVCRDTTVEALEEALRYYLDDVSRVQNNGQAARESLESLGASTFAKQWLAVYRKSARQSGCRRCEA